ncbi:hypothetical protein E2C01_011908 [Portunus trituberculatus]|uniref:Uncharacterized protein n=1 Tax=Portunus trituberculatus TaxID=210409 RepID=A0A5B7DD76_PORTR|nr:hypothetical protein [Portunus trituberculatus]
MVSQGSPPSRVDFTDSYFLLQGNSLRNHDSYNNGSTPEVHRSASYTSIYFETNAQKLYINIR